jgi:hypothetical protein
MFEGQLYVQTQLNLKILKISAVQKVFTLRTMKLMHIKQLTTHCKTKLSTGVELQSVKNYHVFLPHHLYIPILTYSLFYG